MRFGIRIKGENTQFSKLRGLALVRAKTALLDAHDPLPKWVYPLQNVNFDLLKVNRDGRKLKLDPLEVGLGVRKVELGLQRVKLGDQSVEHRARKVEHCVCKVDLEARKVKLGLLKAGRFASAVNWDAIIGPPDSDSRAGSGNEVS